MKTSLHRLFFTLIFLGAPLAHGAVTISGTFDRVPSPNQVIQDPDYKFVFSITLDSGSALGLSAGSPANSYATNGTGAGGPNQVTSWSIQIVKQGITIYDATPASFGAVDARNATFANVLVSGSRREQIDINLNTFSVNGIFPNFSDGINSSPVNQIQLTLLNFIPVMPPGQPSVFSDVLNDPADISQYTIDQIVKAPNAYLYGQAVILRANGSPPNIGSFIYQIPEPTSAGLIAISVLGMLRRRR